MPIPLLFIGIGAGTAALGAGKTIKAAIDQKDAKETNEKAQNLVDQTTKQVNLYRKSSGDALTHLGEQKIDTLENSIKPFIAAFEQIHNVELTDSVGMDELQKFVIDAQSLDELKAMQSTAASLAGGMAGGTAILGGLVAGPALAIMGFVVGANASANKDKAYSNMAEARKYQEEMKTAMVACKGIRRRAAMFDRLLLRLGALFDPLVYDLEHIIATSGTDYNLYTLPQKQTVAAALSLAGAIKAVLDTPILTEDGQITPESEQVSDKATALIEKNHV